MVVYCILELPGKMILLTVLVLTLLCHGILGSVEKYGRTETLTLALSSFILRSVPAPAP